MNLFQISDKFITLGSTNFLQTIQNKQVRIGMVTHGKFPLDPRIEKESLSLVNAGFEVYVYANQEVTPHPTILFKGVKVRYFSLRYSPFFLFFTLPIILRRWFLTDEIKIVHAQDTPLSLPTFIAAKSLQIPVIYDIHEIWHKLVADNVFNLIIKKMVLIPWSKISECIGCKIAKAILVTSDEMASYILHTYKVPSDRIHLVRNVCKIIDPKNLHYINLPKKVFKICYVGNMNSGDLLLDTVIKSMAYLLNRIDFRFYLVGDGRLRPMLENLAKKLNIDNRLEFTGWIPREKAYAYISSSDICIVPYKRNFNANISTPHKLFEYMSLGKPVVMTALTSSLKLVGNAVYIWEPPTSKNLADIIYELYENNDLRQSLGKKGCKLIHEKLNWNTEEKKLLRIYKELEFEKKEKIIKKDMLQPIEKTD